MVNGRSRCRCCWDGAGLSERKVKMAMGLHGSKGRHYKWYSIFPRHILATARAAG
ncbi:hypothetical protein [Photobacterium atrarenae]|uniref:Uncharacterized protein n=1 Tax=Photobacterium atrarenae TaxID=865757 RepID=A0ABY5GQ42_9GAMM|nr:hypothetical protein [Photobacterium atrarenae]UTV31038.1 hypothetical protein NNL38_24435 [Photobacterium atrarenae]